MEYKMVNYKNNPKFSKKLICFKSDVQEVEKVRFEVAKTVNYQHRCLKTATSSLKINFSESTKVNIA